MKPPEELTDEELRIEIAEFCGWYKSDKDDFYWWREDDKGNFLENAVVPPNYPRSLDAMWEAEEKLEHDFLIGSKAPWERYRMNLNWIVYKELNMKGVSHATAKQRAIAFVKTIREILLLREILFSV